MQKTIFILHCLIVLFPIFNVSANEKNQPSLFIGLQFYGNSQYITQPDGEREIADINLKDSRLMLGIDQPLFAKGYGSVTFGMLKSDHDLELHQLNGSIRIKGFQVKIGLTNLRNNIIRFPTLRSSDLLIYTHMLNGEEDQHADVAAEPFDEMAQKYAKTVSFSWFTQRKQYIEIWSSEREGHGDYNTIGIGYFYKTNSSSTTQKIQQAGVLVDRQQVADHDAWLTAYIAGAKLNLISTPSSTISFAAQAISSKGSTSTGYLDSYINMAKHSAYSGVGSLSYTKLHQWQASITLAAKQYHEITNAWQWSIVPTINFFLGKGIELIGQISYTNHDSAINNGVTEIKYELGMSYKINRKFNPLKIGRESVFEN